MVNFVATKFYSAEEKAEIAKKILNFVDKGFRRTMFNRPIYVPLSNMFCHIAHYNAGGFYYRWFETKERQKEWVERVINNETYGDPAYTFSDVERYLRAELSKRFIKNMQLRMVFTK